MIIYNYNQKTKEYTVPGKASNNPRNPVNPLIPANATTESPPDVGVNEVAVFKDKKWKVEKDFRGKKFYLKDSGKEKIIKDIGEKTPVNAIETPPPQEFKKPVYQGNTWIETYTAPEAVLKIDINKLLTQLETVIPGIKKGDIV